MLAETPLPHLNRQEPRVRAGERDFLLLLLAAAAGSADGWSYMGLGHAFVANMTGNTVLIGLAVFTLRDLANPLIALGCYVVGTALGAYLTRKLGEGIAWPRAVSWTLLIEAVLMGASEAAWALLHLASSPFHFPVRALLGCVAFAVGMQSGAMIRLGIPGVVTTYITGTWTTLVSGLIIFRARERGKPRREKLQYEERMLMQAAILAAYLSGAVLTGWLFRHAPVALGVLPSTAVLVAATYGLVRG
jgi:uncharacterized membrane protein YoaK (UPF0700 family)